MDSRFPAWYRAAAIEPKDEFLRKRWKGVEGFVGDTTEEDVLELARLFHSRPLRDPSFLGKFETAIQKSDAAFTATAPGPEVALLAGAVLTQLTTKPSELADIAAMATLVPSCNGAGSPGIVPDIVVISSQYLQARTQNQRPSLPSSTTLKPIGAAKAEGDQTDAAAALKTVTDKVNRLTEVLNVVQSQQRFFREESDVLWWVSGGHSRDMKLPFSDVGFPTVCIIAGKELADLAVTAAGPFAAAAFLDRILKSAGTGPANIQILSAINALASDVVKAWTAILSSPGLDLCPILLGLDLRAKAAGNNWESAYKTASPAPAEKELTPLDFATQVYEEAMLAKAVRKSGAT